MEKAAIMAAGTQHDVYHAAGGGDIGESSGERARTDALILVAGGDVNTPVSDIENEDQGWKWEKSTSTLDGSGTLTLSNVNFEIPSEKVNPEYGQVFVCPQIRRLYWKEPIQLR